MSIALCAMTLAMALLAGVLVPPAALLFLTTSYVRALTTACDAWWMHRRFGTMFLRFMYAQLPWLIDKKMMHLDGKKKAIELAAERPPHGAVAFVGSSTFTYWRHLERDMEAAGVSVPCFNAAFGGSWTKHVLAYAAELCTNWRPRAVVYYCGTNDLNCGASEPGLSEVDSAVKGFIDFHRTLHEALPGTPVVYAAPTVTPFVAARGAELVAKFDEVKSGIRRYAAHACRERPDSLIVVDSIAAPARSHFGRLLNKTDAAVRAARSSIAIDSPNAFEVWIKRRPETPERNRSRSSSFCCFMRR